MGGYGSGGHNKTHDCAERMIYRRADSFRITDRIRYDKFFMYKDEVKIPTGGTHVKFYPETEDGEIYENGEYHYIKFSRVPNIDNFTYRLYFICPYCGRRARYLYRNIAGYYMCRKCSKLNYRSQQLNGLDLIQCKMLRIVEGKLGYYEWDNVCDCIQDLWHIPKPDYMRWDKYEKLIKEYKRLQEEYENEQLKGLMWACKHLHIPVEKWI